LFCIYMHVIKIATSNNDVMKKIRRLKAGSATSRMLLMLCVLQLVTQHASVVLELVVISALNVNLAIIATILITVLVGTRIVCFP